jgi:hypothetical protein
MTGELKDSKPNQRSLGAFAANELDVVFSVHMFHIPSNLMDFDEILYLGFALRFFPRM